MNTKQSEALKLALEALGSCSAGDYSTGHVIHPSFDADAVNKAIEAIDALSEQTYPDNFIHALMYDVAKRDSEALAEQPANVATVNTSEELVDKTAENVHEQPAQGCDYCNHPQYAGTKCKNCGCEQPAQQEPVAHCRVRPLRGDQSFPTVEVDWVSRPVPGPLYTSPPASKPWVGLTDEEIDECYYWKDRQWTTDELVRHVEAKLREKNQ